MTSFIKQKTATFSRPRIIVKYMDATLTTKPLTTATPVDGYTIIDGDIVLFTNLSAVNYTIHRASVSGVNITWTQLALGQSPDGLPSLGDEVFIKAGTYTKKIYWYDGASFIEFKSGGGIGDSSIFGYLNSQDDNVTTQPFTTGNNATFLSAGSIVGTFTQKNETNPLNGKSSYTFVLGATSINDWIATYSISVPLKAQGVTNSTRFTYTYDGVIGDILPVVYDVTNSKIISSTSQTLENTNGVAKVFEMVYDVPSTCSSIKIGFHVKANNNTKTLKFDDIETGVWSPMLANLVEQESVSYTGYMSGTTGGVLFKTKDTSVSNESTLLSVVTSGGFTKYVVLKRSSIVAQVAMYYSSPTLQSFNLTWFKADGSARKGQDGQDAWGAKEATMVGIAEVGDYFIVTSAVALSDNINTHFSISATAISSNVIQSTESKEEVLTISQAQNAMTTRSGELRYALSTASVTINSATQTAASSYYSKYFRVEDDGTRTKIIANQSIVLSVNSSAGMTAVGDILMIYKNGLSGTAVAYGSSAFTASAISSASAEVHLATNEYISFRGNTSVESSTTPFKVSVKASSPSTPTLLALPTSKDNNKTYDANQVSITGITSAVNVKFYPYRTIDKATGLPRWRLAFNFIGNFASTSSVQITIGGVTFGPDGTGSQAISSSSTGFYVTKSVADNGTSNLLITFNNPTTTGAFSGDVSLAGKPAWADEWVEPGVFVGNVAKNQVAYVKDIRTSGSNGGSSVAGTWATRVLGAVEGDTQIVSLDTGTNRITLQAGVYDIDATAPFLKSYSCRIRLKSTDGTTTILGDSSFAASEYNVGVNASLKGMLILTSAKTFELQYIVGVAYATYGLGVATSSGDPEVYTQIKITKLNGN